MSKPKLLIADAHSDERCQGGDVDACLAAGTAAEATNRMSALSLFLKGCDQACPGDRVEHAATVARSCREAARQGPKAPGNRRPGELTEKFIAADDAPGLAAVE